MAPAVTSMMEVLCTLLAPLTLGTNLGLLHVLWALVSGALFPSRGALFPALQAIGLRPAETRRAWAALRYGAWQTADLLTAWEQHVTAEGHWQPATYDGYRPKAVDLVGFYRPALQGCASQHYQAAADKALPAVVLALIGRVGQVATQRSAVLTAIVRGDLAEASEKPVRAQVLRQVAQTLAPDEMPVLDAGFKISELQAAGLSRYEVRLAKNFTARRNVLPEYKDKGRKPEYGALVRPLARQRQGKVIPATPPDQVETWTSAAGEFQAEIWHDLVLPGVKVSSENATFHVAAVHDPRYQAPWLLACPVALTGAAWHGLYQARWPIEQLPLAAKQMVGAERQFVSAPESCYRLPELALVAGMVLTYQAATQPAIPTGFWDRNPQPTPGRLRRVLAGVAFPQSYALPPQLRKKAAVVAHLPKGILGHRRQKRAASP
jgi:hypothetical protein